MDLGRIYYQNARVSGIVFSQLGSGLTDHIGFFGPTGAASAVQVGSFQDTTFMTKGDGSIASYLGAGSGALTNCKWTSTSGVRISGLPRGPYNKLLSQVNVFNPANLSTYPHFVNRSSGTLLIRYVASGVAAVHTYNAKMWAYDATGSLTDPPPDVTVNAFEINASGQWFDASHSGVWRTIHGQGNAMFFANHSPANGWTAQNTHIWVAALSIKANSVGVLDDMNFAVSLQFA